MTPVTKGCIIAPNMPVSALGAEVSGVRYEPSAYFNIGIRPSRRKPPTLPYRRATRHPRYKPGGLFKFTTLPCCPAHTKIRMQVFPLVRVVGVKFSGKIFKKFQEK
jgi:hypothetical protein